MHHPSKFRKDRKTYSNQRALALKTLLVPKTSIRNLWLRSGIKAYQLSSLVSNMHPPFMFGKDKTNNNRDGHQRAPAPKNN